MSLALRGLMARLDIVDLPVIMDQEGFKVFVAIKVTAVNADILAPMEYLVLKVMPDMLEETVFAV